MQYSVVRAGNQAHQRSTSLFGRKLSHPSGPRNGRAAAAHSGGQTGGPCVPLVNSTTPRHDGRDRAGLAVLLLTGLLVIGGPTAAVSAQRASAQSQPASDHFAAHVAEAARRFGIPAAWIRTVMRVESNGDRRAVSPKGALGLMQLMPKTWADMRARYGLGRDPFDPRDNILAGAAFLRELHDRYGSPGFLAAYNAGPGRYEEFRDRHRPLPAETTAYVAAIVPFVDAEETSGPLPLAAFSRSSWTRAPLFFGHVDGPSRGARAALDQPAHGGSAATPVHDVSAIAPQSEGLFVALSATGRSQ
ncbi:lytic transglycosylase domain-containing protein [Bradyrhizobium sp. NBAIM03]|uniref:lytic transglycosylase domain-containing protein n=1 Tax=Bradyrhizobium sp. NBAIM03 TaxID=2793816 RepID=UPI001CD42243|nr:lytic transglycosylase domain-containing protein [Bradyrhizobium sp. NBAIM03]MCA1537736.1 lytic transglycosylase domain-containing protein [Bradyrhizobium sp. NBAIM03]